MNKMKLSNQELENVLLDKISILTGCDVAYDNTKHSGVCISLKFDTPANHLSPSIKLNRILMVIADILEIEYWTSIDVLSCEIYYDEVYITLYSRL